MEGEIGTLFEERDAAVAREAAVEKLTGQESVYPFEVAAALAAQAAGDEDREETP